MPDLSPLLETVITAVQSAIDAVNPAYGSVLTSDFKEESERLAIEQYQQSDGAIDVWVITADNGPEVEGEAPGEYYCILQIACQYWNVRVGDANWEKTARQLVTAIQTALSGNAGIFRIGGQVPLHDTPETATIESQGFQLVEDMKVYKGVITLQVEARRWS